MSRPVAKAKVPISVIERRIKSGRIFSQGSQPIPLVEPDRWSIRIVNTQISDSRLWEMQADKGWIHVASTDLAVKPEEVGFREQDGRVVRGTHGHEVLMKMERTEYAAVQKAKDQTNRELTFSQKALRPAIANVAAQSVDAGGLGDGGQGADFLSRAQLHVADSLERVRLDE